MVAAGAPVESILAAIEADQRAEIERVQARRIADRERKRLSRLSESSGQRRNPADSADADPSLTSSLSSSNTSEILREEGRKKERRARSQTSLPDDWIPKEAHFEKAQERGLSNQFVREKADDMRNWAKSKGIRRADWDATFHGFLRPKESTAIRVNGHAARPPNVATAFDDLLDRTTGEGRDLGAEIRDITPGRD